MDIDTRILSSLIGVVIGWLAADIYLRIKRRRARIQREQEFMWQQLVAQQKAPEESSYKATWSYTTFVGSNTKDSNDNN
jgi:hypothetical protein